MTYIFRHLALVMETHRLNRLDMTTGRLDDPAGPL
jgi:hypothetical protein